MNTENNSTPENFANTVRLRALERPVNVTSSSRYVLFDLLRGLAAVAVLVFHMNYMLGSYSPGLHKGYLAVDFFFLLSGFVIAANYHATVRPAISWSEFLIVRFARLWPLFFVATLFGCVAIVSKLSRDSGYFDTSAVLASLTLNSLMLPSFFQAYGVDRLFLFNGASWSVFFEVVINLVFFAALRRLSLKPLITLSIALAGLLVWIAYANGSLDGGWAAATFHVGSARVLFGFTTGMALYLGSLKIRLHLNGWAAASLVAGLVLSFFVNGNWRVDCVMVIFGYPALILLAAKCDLKGIAARLGGRLGDISYSVYLLQTPAMLFVAGASKALIGRKIAEFAPVSGVLFVIGLLGVSYLSWRYFEVPARNVLRRRLSAWHKRSLLIAEGIA